MANTNEDDVDIENVDDADLEDQGVSCKDVIFKDSGLISDANDQWNLYDDQKLLGGEAWPSYDDEDMDPESRATIERMLKEEKHYLQRGSNLSNSKTKKAISNNKRSDKPHIVKGSWTDEEVACFHEGLELFGRQWSKVAEHIGTRTTLQVKNYGRNHLKKMASKESTSLDNKLYDSTNKIELTPERFNTDDVHSHLPYNFETASATCISPPRGRPKKKPHLSQPKNAVKMQPTCKLPSPTKKTKRDTPKSPQKEEMKVQADDMELDPTKVNIIEEKTEESHVKIKEGERVHLQDASGSEEDVDVEEEDSDELETCAMKMGVTDSLETINTEDSLIKDEDDVFRNLGKDGYTGEDLEQSKHVNLSSTHTKRVPEMEIITCKGGEEAVSPPMARNESLPSSGQQRQVLEQQISDDDKMKNEQIKEKSNNAVDMSSSTSGNEEGGVVDTPAPKLDLAESEIDDTSIDMEEITPKATEELILENDTITEREKLLNPEYFKPGTSRTPQRYLTIRNKIIDCWNKCKPSYVTKTAVRPNLRGCGDVNKISAIHSALEHLGAINFGIENPFHVVISARTKTRNSRVEVSPRAIILRPRQKRLCNSEEEKVEKLRIEAKAITKVSSRPTKKPKVAYDPFKLIQCFEFTESNLAPYHVVINLSALIVMDLHAHLATTEVIGLLGGDYNETKRVLEITDAKPCKSLSTGMQCEMDPVSQTEASESIMSAGGRVVGWYHSHPTFAPNPSVRDIETQSDFQAWFGPHVPYVGVIVSPYLRSINAGSTQSVFKCLTISHELSEDADIGKPYSFSFTVKPDLINNKNTLLGITKDIITQYATYLYRTEMLKWKFPHNPDKPYMEKVLTSIKSHLSSTLDSEPSHSSTCSEILAVIRSQITSGFQQKSNKSPDKASTSGEALANIGDMDEAISKQDKIQNESTAFDEVT